MTDGGVCFSISVKIIKWNIDFTLFIQSFINHPSIHSIHSFIHFCFE